MELLKKVDVDIVSILPKDVINHQHYYKFEVEPSKKAQLFQEYLQASYNVDAISIFIERIAWGKKIP